MNDGKMREIFGIQAAAAHLISAVRIEELVKEMKKKYTIAIVTHNMLKATRVWDIAAFFFSGERAEAVLPGRSSL